MNVNEPLMKCRKLVNYSRQKRGRSHLLIRPTDICLLVGRHSVLRWHQSYLGLCRELGKHHQNAKGKSLKLEKRTETPDVWACDGDVRSSDEASVMEVERRGIILQSELYRNSARKRNL